MLSPYKVVVTNILANPNIQQTQSNVIIPLEMWLCPPGVCLLLGALKPILWTKRGRDTLTVTSFCENTG